MREPCRTGKKHAGREEHGRDPSKTVFASPRKETAAGLRGLLRGQMEIILEVQDPHS